jgi:dTDP-4-dehydrorhamnose 3,5-epimerase
VRFIDTPLAPACLVELDECPDERGFFARAYCEREFAERGLTSRFVNTNLSRTRRKGTLRGLHYQRPPHAEAKLVRCTRGAIYDVIIDLRPQAATWGRWLGVELTAANLRQLYVPEGFAHGFVTLVDDTEVTYQVSAFFAPEAESGVRWNDPAFAIEWPVAVVEVSDKDRNWPLRTAAGTPP